MISTATRIEDLTLNVTEEIHVRASLEATFTALLEQLGPFNAVADDKPMPMKIEPWPGGRWYRDLGDGNGHFWGVVQAIKRPRLLEIPRNFARSLTQSAAASCHTDIAGIDPARQAR